MKQLIIACVLLLCLGSLIAIQVSGNQSGTWDPVNNPYEVVGAITVPAGQNLEILPGVEVQITGNFQITVAGTMQAIGTEADSIRFLNPLQPTLWPGLRFENETQASSLSHIYVEYATYGVRCLHSPLSITYSRMNHCEKGMELNAIGDAEPHGVTVDHCLIENCIQNGILIAQNSAAVITNNEIRYNGTGTQFRAAIQLSNQSAGGSNNPLIEGNHIHHNYKQGISAWDVATSNAINPTITNNIIEYNYTGIYYLQASGYCANNQINNNFIPGDMNSGAGVMVSGVTSIPYFEGNTISGNYAGFYITNNAMPVLGDLSIYHSWAQGENYIRDNIDATGNNNAIFCAAYANAGNIIKAENNYWDYETAPEINSVIMDHTDSASLPTIDFDPWLEEVQETVISGTIVSTLPLNNVQLDLVSVSSGLVIGSTTISESNQINWVFTPAEPFYAVVFADDGWNQQYGASGGLDQPTIFDPAAGFQINLGDIVCSETPPDSWIRIDNPVMQEGLLTYPVRYGFFVYHWNQTEHLYQDGDFLKIYKMEQMLEGSEISSYIYPEENRSWEKVFNVSAGDTWTKRLALLNGGEPFFLNLEVTAYEVGGIEAENRLMVSYLLSDGREYCQRLYSPEENLFFQRSLPGTGGCFMHKNGSFEQIPVTVEPDGSLFPLVSGNYYLLQNRAVDFQPTHLVYDVPALTTDPRLVKLYWQPMLWDSVNPYTYYRVYRNEELVATLPAAMNFIQYEEPYPSVPGTYSYYIKSASESEESLPSNTVTFTAVSGEDPIQPPTPMAVWPNPFRPGSGELQIRLGSQATAQATLKVYNLRGQVVRELPISGDPEQTQSWDLLDSRGRACASGIYLLRLEKDGLELTGKKVVILK